MGSHEWCFSKSDVLVPAARVAALQAKFMDSFSRSVAKEFAEHGVTVQWDEDESDLEEGQESFGERSLVGLSSDDVIVFTDEFESALVTLAAFLDGTGTLDVTSADDQHPMRVVLKPINPDDPMVGGSYETQHFDTFHVNMKDVADVHSHWKSFIRDLLKSGRTPEDLKAAVDEAACAQVVEA
jgi:hypothetical protein